MPGVWAQDGDQKWRPLTARGFISESDLHDLIEQAPAMLPLAGAPTLAVVGREVVCGRERADLLAVEIQTGRPVIVEIKLAANADRRQALTQVLGYAAYLRRLNPDGMNAVVQRYLAKAGFPSIVDAVKDAAQGDAGFDQTSFEIRFADALADGRLRAVIVLDSAPPDLVELVGYLQEVTSDRLTLDLVVVTAYEVDGHRVLVPQLVEPDRTQVTAELAGSGSPSVASPVVPGSAEFETSVEASPVELQPALMRLLEWCRGLEQQGLAVLFTSIGKGRWVLNPRLPGQTRGMVTIWNENGAYLSPYRTVLSQVAPKSLAALDAKVPGQIGQGNYIKAELDDELLDLFSAAYIEANGR
jgi:hypothetical protein